MRIRLVSNSRFFNSYAVFSAILFGTYFKRTEHVEKSTYIEYIVYDYQTISSKRIKFPAQVSDSIWFYGEKERSTWLGNDDQTCTSEVITESSSEFGLGLRLKITMIRTSLGWVPGFSGFSRPANETWIWIAQIVELQKSLQMIPKSNQSPGNWASKIHVLTFAWAFG